MAYDRAAFLAKWKAAAEAQRIELAAQRAEMARQNEEWLKSSGRRPAEGSTAATPLPPPPPPRPAPIVAIPPTAAELKFARVRKETCARIAAERDTRRAEEAGVAMILDAFQESLASNDCRQAAMQPRR